MQVARALQLKEEEAHAKVLQRDEELPAAERVRRLLFNLVIESVVLSSDEMSFISSQLETTEARQQLSEFL